MTMHDDGPSALGDDHPDLFGGRWETTTSGGSLWVRGAAGRRTPSVPGPGTWPAPLLGAVRLLAAVLSLLGSGGVLALGRLTEGHGITRSSLIAALGLMIGAAVCLRIADIARVLAHLPGAGLLPNLSAFTGMVAGPFLFAALAVSPLGMAMVAAALDAALGAVLLAWAIICVTEADQRRAFLLHFEGGD